eukprot:6927416-Pyramimonas_sp.AAC.1
MGVRALAEPLMPPAETPPSQPPPRRVEQTKVYSAAELSCSPLCPPTLHLEGMPQRVGVR